MNHFMNNVPNYSEELQDHMSQLLIDYDTPTHNAI